MDNPVVELVELVKSNPRLGGEIVLLLSLIKHYLTENQDMDELLNEEIIRMWLMSTDSGYWDYLINADELENEGTDWHLKCEEYPDFFWSRAVDLGIDLGLIEETMAKPKTRKKRNKKKNKQVKIVQEGPLQPVPMVAAA